MNLGELFIKIGVQGDTKKLEKAINQLEEAEKKSGRLVKYKKDLAKAASDEEKALIKRNFAEKVRLDNLRKQRTELKAQSAQWFGLVKGVGAFIGAATIAYKVVDRMINSLAQANQQMITFQRTTGISFASLNKYASANAAVNYNSTIEGTAQSMQRVAQNLWDIQMGRGDISPFQELAYVGGKAFNPYGMSVEQVIESVREGIKGVNDIQATNIITRMGFAPDDLLMLRMSREEFEKINGLFLDPKQREAMNKYALQLKKTRLEFNLLKEKTLIAIMPFFIKLANHIKNTAEAFLKLVNSFRKSNFIVSGVKAISGALGLLLLALNPVIAKLSLLFLLLEDFAYWNSGKKSFLGDLIGDKAELPEKHPKAYGAATLLKDIIDTAKRVHSGELTGAEGNALMQQRFQEAIEKYGLDFGKSAPVDVNKLGYIGNTGVNTSNSFTINSNQPADIIAESLINKFTPTQVQYGVIAV